MAHPGRVKIDVAGLDRGDGSLRQALEIWSSRNGPVKFYQWQSVFHGLVRHGFKDEEATPNETQVVKAARIRSYYNEIQRELHGDDHMTLAIIGPRYYITRGE